MSTFMDTFDCDEYRDPSLHVGLARVRARLERESKRTEQIAEAKRAKKSAAFRNPDGPVRHGAATLTDILGTRR